MKAVSRLLVQNKFLLKFVLILAGLFPLLPFKFKGLVIIVLLAVALWLLKNRDTKFNYFNLINSVLFISYLLSLFYTDDVKYGMSMLESTASLFLVPIGFVLISRNLIASKSIIRYENLFKIVFITSSLVLSILIIVLSLNFGDYVNEKININSLVFTLNEGFYWMKDHPIYISIYLSLSLLMIISLYSKKQGYYSVYLIISGFIQLFVLVLLSRKGVILSFFIVSIIFILFEFRKKKKGILIGLTFLVLTPILVFNYAPDTVKRFKEVLDVKSYTKVESFSSTSIRFAIFNCSVEKIKGNMLFGYGIGDVKNELNKCYNEVSEILFKGNYNSHNQFLGIILSVGIIGLLIFLISVIINLRLFYRTKDYFAFCMLLLFMFFMLTENILDRQNGVILFSFLINYYTFKNIKLSENS